MSTSSLTIIASSDTLLTSTVCSKCGTEFSQAQLQELQDAQARIEDLESQVKILTLRATSAVERATEYEVSLRRLTAASRSPTPQGSSTLESSTSPSGAASAPTIPVPVPAQTSTSRLARLLSTRSTTAPVTSSAARGSSVPQSSQSTSAIPSSNSDSHRTEASLLDALTHEKSLRQAAETAAAQTNSEIEELTGQLFQQANEMVATERKARAKLEARVEILEKRDNDKAKRLGLLEMRVQRVERVRGLLDGEKSDKESFA